MRVDSFELEVVLTDGAGASRGALQEVFDAGSQQMFVVAAPGQAFDIHCSYLGPPMPAGTAYLVRSRGRALGL